jgi:hypothetical protein
MRDDPPAVFLLWPEVARAISARFRVPLSPDRDVIYTLPHWTLASPPDAPGVNPLASSVPSPPSAPSPSPSPSSP